MVNVETKMFQVLFSVKDQDDTQLTRGNNVKVGGNYCQTSWSDRLSASQNSD